MNNEAIIVEINLTIRCPVCDGYQTTSANHQEASLVCSFCQNRLTINGAWVTNQSADRVWECNECGFQGWTTAISESDILNLGCIECGGSEFHKANYREMIK